MVDLHVHLIEGLVQVLDIPAGLPHQRLAMAPQTRSRGRRPRGRPQRGRLQQSAVSYRNTQAGDQVGVCVQRRGADSLRPIREEGRPIPCLGSFRSNRNRASTPLLSVPNVPHQQCRAHHVGQLVSSHLGAFQVARPFRGRAQAPLDLGDLTLDRRRAGKLPGYRRH